jgi:hypothetical protein
MRTFEISAAIGAAALLSAAVATAAPVVTAISGTPSQGQTVRISGTGFGTKSRAAPLVFDDFEAGTAGQQVQGKTATAGQWNTGSYAGGVTYTTFEGRKVARHQFGNGTYNSSLYVDPAPTQTVYLDFWIKGVPISNPSRNWKTWRFYNSSDSEVGNSVYYCVGGGIDMAGSWVWTPETPPPQTWIHYEVIQKPGMVRHYRDGKLDLSNSNSSPPTVAQVRIGHYWGLDGVDTCSSNPGGNVYTDNVYVDNSLARVVLGDQPTFELSRKRAIQQPTAWSGSEVSVRFYSTGFTTGEQAYLFVIDPNNVASPGYPVRIGEGAVVPNPPTNVSAT